MRRPKTPVVHLQEMWMAEFLYQSGEAIQVGDQITYHGEHGTVERVIRDRTGVAEHDWYLDQFPGGGIMISAIGFGSVFISEVNDAEDLIFVSRG